MLHSSTGNDPYYGGTIQTKLRSPSTFTKLYCRPRRRLYVCITQCFFTWVSDPCRVITSSLANGPLVLRHELGHSIINVGEEYDGGYAYFGPNAAHNLSEPLPWVHWLSEPRKHRRAPHIERSAMPMQSYAWALLNTSTPWSIKFTSSGIYSRHVVRFSLSGLPDKRDLKVELDGTNLCWTPRADIGLDRWHYDIHRDQVLSAGEHEVKFTLENAGREGVAQLCSVEILEFGDDDESVLHGYYL